MADGWRTRDLRGDEGPAGSVVSVVRHARRGLAGARAGESVLFGATAVLCALSAAAWTGANMERVDAWCVALVCGALAGVSWWSEHRKTAAEVARKLDERLRHQGALVTAFELEQRGADDGPLAPLVIGHVLSRLRKREALRAVRPALGLPVAAPLFGAAILAIVLQAVAVEPTPPPFAAVSGGLVERLNGSLSSVFADESADLAFVGDLRAAAVEARGLAKELGDGVEPPAPDLAERIEALDRRLADLAAAAMTQPERGDAVRAELTEARSWLDALRQGLEDDPGGSADPRGADPGDAIATAEPGTGGDGVTGKGGDGTMSGSTSPADDGVDPPEPPADGGASEVVSVDAGAVEHGAAGNPWWAPEHDAIVRRWLERVR